MTETVEVTALGDPFVRRVVVQSGPDSAIVRAIKRAEELSRILEQCTPYNIEETHADLIAEYKNLREIIEEYERRQHG